MLPFADMSSVTGQATGGAYGPKSSDEFQTTSVLEASAPVTAYAVTDGHIAVLEQPAPSGSNPQLVNVILKPSTQPVPGFPTVKYFIYRGLRESDFVGNPGKLLVSTTSGLSRAVTEIYDQVNARTGGSETELPKENAGLGLSLAGTDDLDDLFYPDKNSGGPSFTPIRVRAGWSLGKFDPSSVGFEIVLERAPFVQDITFARKEIHKVDVSMDSGPAKQIKRERIRYFVDPAAYYGFYYPQDQSLYSSVISKFDTKNRVYLDIRGENDYSYDFYGNYDVSGDNLKVGFTGSPTPGTYRQQDWPITFVEGGSLTTTDTIHKLYIGLVRKGNPEPILIIECGTHASPVEQRTFFTNKTGQLGTAGDWTANIAMGIPTVTLSAPDRVAVSTLVQLYYTRQSPYDDSGNPIPDNVVAVRSFNDTLFGPLGLKTGYDASPSSNVKWSLNPETRYVDARGLSFPNLNTSGLYDRGVAYESGGGVVFFALRSKPHERAGEQATDMLGLGRAGIGSRERLFDELRNLNPATLNPLFRQDVEVPGSSPAVNMGLLFFERSDMEHIEPLDDVFALCLTTSELQSLESVTGFNTDHSRFLKLDALTSVTLDAALGGTLSGFQATVTVHGWDDSASDPDEKVQGPTTPITVYSVDGRIFVSPGYADVSPAVVNEGHSVDYEEEQAVGRSIAYFSSVPPAAPPLGSVKSDPDTIINTTSTIVQVIYGTSGSSSSSPQTDSFRAKLRTALVACSAYEQYRSLIETEAKRLWTTAVAAVKAMSYANPDDRPLYWARLIMRSDIKAFSKLIPNTEALLAEFEWHSRGFSLVDFSGTPSGTKKLLVSGFDPFGLDDRDPVGGNLAGSMAMALQNSTITSGSSSADIQTVVFPVRWKDFTDGLVERVFGPYIEEVDCAITISWMPTFDAFHFDRFAVQHRKHATDNMKKVPESQHHYGDPYYETTLPVVATLGDTAYTALGNQKARYAQFFSYKATVHDDADPPTFTEKVETYENRTSRPRPENDIVDLVMDITGDTNTTVTITSDQYNYPGTQKIEELLGGVEPRWIPLQDVPGYKQTITSQSIGSGGSYLSNEIFYRVARLRESSKSKPPTGHLHVNNPMEWETDLFFGGYWKYEAGEAQADIEILLDLLGVFIKHV